MRQSGLVFPVVPEAGPPFHFINSASDHAMVWVDCESRKDSLLTEREIVLDVLDADVARINQALSVSHLDILEQLRRVDIAAGGHQ